MSDTDPENGDPIESPEPEDDLAESDINAPFPQDGDDTNSVEGESCEADSGLCGEGTDAQDVQHTVGIDDRSHEAVANQLVSGDTDRGTEGQLTESQNGVEPSETHGTGESLLAEDELNLNVAPGVDFSRTEWSLEPEDAVNFESQACGGAEGVGDNNNNGREVAVEDEAEALQNYPSGTESSSQIIDPCVYHRTESSCQLDVDHGQTSDDIGAEGVNNSNLVSSVYPSENLHMAGASNVQGLNDMSIPDEDDYSLQPEGEYIAELENEPTEADQGREVDGAAAACSVVAQPDALPEDAVVDDQCSEKIKRADIDSVKTVSSANTAILEDSDENNQLPREMNCDENFGEQLGESSETNGQRAIPEDEICEFVLEKQSDQQDNLDSEFDEPECDQSSVEACESSPNHVASIDNQSDEHELSDNRATEQESIQASTDVDTDCIVVQKFKDSDLAENSSYTLDDCSKKVLLCEASEMVKLSDHLHVCDPTSVVSGHGNTQVLPELEKVTESHEDKLAEHCEMKQRESPEPHIGDDDTGNIVNTDASAYTDNLELNCETKQRESPEPHIGDDDTGNIVNTDASTYTDSLELNCETKQRKSPEPHIGDDDTGNIVNTDASTYTDSLELNCETKQRKSPEPHIGDDDTGNIVNTDASAYTDNLELNCDIENNTDDIDRCKGAIPKHSVEQGDFKQHQFENGTIPKYNKSHSQSYQSRTDDSLHGTSLVTNEQPKKTDSVIHSDPNLEDELLSELDATLPNGSGDSSSANNTVVDSNSAILKELDVDQYHIVKCDQCMQNNLQCVLPSGVHKTDKSFSQDVKELRKQLHQAKQLLLDRECEISRLKDQSEERGARYDAVVLERDSCCKELNRLRQYSADDLYLPQIRELEYTISQQQSEVKGLKDKLASHDIAAKRAIATLQNEMKLRIDQVTKMYEDANREKDSMVVKFAQAEHKNLEYMKQTERAEGKIRESEKERESIFLQLRAIKEQRRKLSIELEAKNSEISSTLKELDKQRELVSSGNVRVKWAQNKLKAELEAHKDTKTQFDRVMARLKEAREETQQIRHDCQDMIKTYQESEEVKSNSLDKELRLKESAFLMQEQEKNSFELAHVKTQRELEQTMVNVRECQKQNASLRERISGLESEKDELLMRINKFTEIIQRQKKEIQDLREKVEHLVQVKGDFTRAQDLIKSLDAEVADLKISNKDLVADMEACRRRETDKLELTAKLSRKNADLQSDNTTLSNKVLTLTGELQNTRLEYQDVGGKFKELTDALANEKRLRQEESQTYYTKLAGKAKAVEDLTRKVDDERDEIKTLKRKHTNNVKDLTRQLQQVRRKLDNYEASTNGDKDTTSLGSRTSSNGSLNTVGTDLTGTLVTPSVAVHGQTIAGGNRYPSPEQLQEYPVITEQVEIEKHVLVEKIVKLQRGLARKNEKIEFMDDHISQLVDEIQKKGKLIQNYVMREETGTMTSELSDKSKRALGNLAQAEIMKTHSIMGSVYSSHSTDSAMTFDLSMEINRKLQAVLEDALLKNITLKESLETLGQEIARLSQENRHLQLQLQGKSRQRAKPSPR